MVAVGGLTVLVVHFALVWYRKMPHPRHPATQPSGVLLRAGVTRLGDLPEVAVDARIAKIINEIPQRRIRQHV